MRTRALLRLFAALFVVALLATACGDDDTTATTGETPDQPDSTDGEEPDGEVSDSEVSDSEMSDSEMSDSEMSDGEASHDDHEEGDEGQMPDGEMSEGEMSDGHTHGTVDVAGAAAPSVDLEVVADPAGGVNIHVLTENYTIAPRAASTEHVDGEGHFHLYVDGEKVLRFYNEWIYYAGVTEGDVTIAVELSANDHRAYAVDGEKIIAETVFTVPAHSHDAHSHDEATPVEWVGEAPTIGLEVLDDPKSGWNAFVSLDGLTLSAEHVSGEHVDGEGHLHIYANGQKLGRLYDLASHLAVLPEGDVEITVVAYTNDHNPYVIDGQPISAAATVTVAS